MLKPPCLRSRCPSSTGSWLAALSLAMVSSSPLPVYGDSLFPLVHPPRAFHCIAFPWGYQGQRFVGSLLASPVLYGQLVGGPSAGNVFGRPSACVGVSLIPAVRSLRASPLYCFPLGLPGAPVCGYTCVAIRAWLDARGYTCVFIRAWLYAHGCTCVAMRTWPHAHC